MKYFKRISLLVFVFASFATVKADEGMWTISNLNSALVQKMKSSGLQLSADQIYSESKTSTKDAVMMFDNGCSGELVSANGLLFTNHHCGRDKIQKVSTDEHNYIRDGFWASSPAEEIPIKGLNVKFLVKTIDVTQQAIELLKTKMIRKASFEIEKQYNDSVLGYVASMDGYSTGQYFVSVYQVFNDVRLVGVPPESIGNFGGETDNFEWPRQSADFSVFRVYANVNNLPTTGYSAENKPFEPKTFLPISLSGIKENDFAMTIGFPWMSQRYISSYDLKEELESKDKATAITKGKYIEVLKREMDMDEAVRLKYSSKNFSAGNSSKLALGTIKLVNLSTAMENKVKAENEFQTWVKADTARTRKYGKCLAVLQKSHEQQRHPKYAHAVISGALFEDGSLLGIRARNIVDLLEKKDEAKLAKAIDTYKKWYASFSKSYNPATDKMVTRAMIKLVKNEIKPEFLPTFYSIIEKEYQGNVDNYVNDIYSKSFLTSAAGIEEYLKKPDLSIKNDPLFIFGTSVYEKLIDLKKITSDPGVEIRTAKKLYEKGVREKEAGLLRYPEANFTMRLTYGKVSGANPRDGLCYKSQSTLTGVIEKEDTTNYEFLVSSKLKDLYYKKDFGRYGEKGQMYTCFLTNTDITGGNSGSPVMNGKGELIGIAFDGNWESLASSIIYEPEKNRAVNVDIRYVLFVIDKFAGSNYILKDLKIK
ncbi:MAG: S46 family peptidase [Paludibacter sp.]